MLLPPAKPGGVRPIADFPHKSCPIGVRLEVFRPVPDPNVGADVIGPLPQVPPGPEGSDLAVLEELVEIVSCSFLLFPKLHVELRPNVLSMPAELDAADVVVVDDAAARLLDELVLDRALISKGAMFTDPGVKLGSSLGSFIPFHGFPGWNSGIPKSVSLIPFVAFEF